MKFCRPDFHIRSILIALLLTPVGLWANSFTITQAIKETVGTTPVITGSGSLNNTDVWALGQVGRFVVTDEHGQAYGLQVDAVASSGSLTPGTDSLMVARTTNSQGLTDRGTLSIYVNTSRTSALWTLDIRFTFFDSNFSSEYPVNDLLLTSMDIDANQKYSVKTADYYQNLLFPNTAITSSVSGDYTTFTAGGDAQFRDPRHAVRSYLRNGRSSMVVRLSHTSMALYMFEFRNPSLIIPEPNRFLLGVIACALSPLLRCRRSA